MNARMHGRNSVRLGLGGMAAASIRCVQAVHPIAAVPSEYSLWSCEPEAEVLPPQGKRYAPEGLALVDG